MRTSKSKCFCAVVALSFYVFSFSKISFAESLNKNVKNNIAQESETISKLKLNQNQQSEFKKYLGVISKKPDHPSELSQAQFYQMTVIDRVDFIYSKIEIDLQRAHEIALATHQFYQSLTVDQQKLFDEITKRSEGHLGVAKDNLLLPTPPGPDYSLPSHTDAHWMIVPNGDDLARVYPAAAVANGVGGKAIISCVADENGYLANCIVREESPKDQGFGNAALEMTGYMRMYPATNYGVPISSVVTVPVNFNKAQ